MPSFWDFPYPSARMPVLARNVVAASQPLATQAGVDVLRRGGNAVDAALSAAITLTVVEPTANGLGSDAFAMVWDGTELRGLNGSGRAPAAWSPQRFAGRSTMPHLGWDTVTVPGAVQAWWDLSQRFGRLPFTDLFAAAIAYADSGFAVAPVTAAKWREAETLYAGWSSFCGTFLPGGRAPRAGECFRCPDLAATLGEIATGGADAFYRGRLAQRITDCAAAAGAVLAPVDLASHRSDWVTPLATAYRDVVLHELPPNGQGIAALIAAGILDRLKLADLPMDGADSLHLQIEAMKLAFYACLPHIAEPAAMTVAPNSLLDADFLSGLARKIRPDRALEPPGPIPTAGGTVTLTAADADGMMVSLIQSNYLGFGSGIVVEGTGISLQNRGCGFNLIAGHPNCVGGGKRPFHTIIPAFVTRAGRPVMSFGVMGAHMQAQGHLQMLVRMFDYGLNPQAACDAPRWHVDRDGGIALEPGFTPEVVEALRRRGHRILPPQQQGMFGGAQLILRTANSYCAGSDHRKDGQAAGF